MLMPLGEFPKRAASLFDQDMAFMANQKSMLCGEPVFFITNTANNCEIPLAPEFENLDGQLSLPDLGGVSVDFAKYEDY